MNIIITACLLVEHTLTHIFHLVFIAITLMANNLPAEFMLLMSEKLGKKLGYAAIR